MNNSEINWIVDNVREILIAKHILSRGLILNASPHQLKIEFDNKSLLVVPHEESKEERLIGLCEYGSATRIGSFQSMDLESLEKSIKFLFKL